ncbi:arsenite methyltransferase [Nocardia uniformis]|uniref:Arsenite methyltransferase n=1 Tax=Nocardia uniformis TaxID=53432 RepID=A0A849BV66_9NOCA|nr:arsenite methyltransferase [Nocardia uniformis]NNH68806.1 arsenite methyltransferase [Nocardia uniformis]
MSADSERLREAVRNRYASAATRFIQTSEISDSGCCDPSGCGSGTAEAVFGGRLYPDEEREIISADVVAASLGCGNPLAVAELHEGEVVLDLGSGAGLDVLLSARRVGPSGTAYGLDMTDEMLALAESNAREAGVENVEFLRGVIESIPLPDASIDVVISNCVINLSVDKPAVFAETFRVLRPGGRIGVTDVVAEDQLSPQDRAARGDYVGCIAGALTLAEFRSELTAAGFTDIDVTPTHEVAAGMHSAMIKATRPR